MISLKVFGSRGLSGFIFFVAIAVCSVDKAEDELIICEFSELGDCKQHVTKHICLGGEPLILFYKEVASLMQRLAYEGRKKENEKW